MNFTTNIILTGNHGRTESYIIQLIPEPVYGEYKYVHQNDENWPGSHSMFFDSSMEYVLSKKGNEWYTEEDLGGKTYKLKKSTLRVYIPQYSADTFINKCIYMFNAFIYIAGQEIELGCFKFQKKDCIACPPKKFDGMNEYYEYIDFEIPDPHDIYFEQESLPVSLKNHQAVDNASRLYISLYVVEPYDTKYIMKDGWTGGQNNMPVVDNQNLGVDIKYVNEDNNLNLNLVFNNNYGWSIVDYMKNIYCLDVLDTLRWELVIMDDENIYYQLIKTSDESNPHVEISDPGDFNNDFNNDFLIAENFKESIVININDLKNYDINNFLKSWSNWKSGLYLMSSATIRCPRKYYSSFDDSFDDSYGPIPGDLNNDPYNSSMSSNTVGVEHDSNDVPIIKIYSNKLPVTPELFSKMLDHNGFPDKIKLSDLNMNDITINAINKIEKNVQSLTYNIESPKNHMIQPVFYQTRELSQSIIHPAVTENISLNLETYKPYVKRFLLRIEGVSFKEIGRTSQGIIFKIFGNMLPKSANEGTMYVLDQDSNLVTTGKYKYEY